MKTLREFAAAVDRALPLCEALARTPDDRAARAALLAGLVVFADRSFPATCREASAEIRALCNLVHIQATILCERLANWGTEPAHFSAFLANRAQDLMSLLPELRKTLERTPGY